MNIRNGEYIIIPGGWTGLNCPGHAMLYVITHDNKFVIVNTGSGI
jgi:hypothetical protein